MNDQLFNAQRFWSDCPAFFPAMDARDSELDREDSLSDRYAFQLGEDMGILRLAPFEYWSSAEMERGFVHGLKRQAKRSDLYTRKLITLRCNAFARSIPISSTITSDYLKVLAVAVCPVSGVVLTSGAQADTNWSIDRLDNSIGYVPGNLCVVSQRVNRLKGDSDFATVANDARDAVLDGGADGLGTTLPNGLLVIEAFRLAALMAAPSGFARGALVRYVPFAMAPSSWATIDGVVAGVHLSCIRSRTEGAAQARRAALFKRLGKETWQLSNRLVSRLRSTVAGGLHAADSWFDGDVVSLLAEVTDVFMRTPPVLAGVDTCALANQLNAQMAPLGAYTR